MESLPNFAVGLAALIGGYFFIRKTLSKQKNRPGPALAVSAPSPFSDGSSANDEGPMVMARSYPDVAARLEAIAARAERGEPGQTMASQPPRSQQNNRTMQRRENPFTNKGSADFMSEEAPLVMARSYPGIAAELGAIAARAERGELASMVPQQPPLFSQNERERGGGFPFPERDTLPSRQQGTLQPRYYTPEIGRSAPGREPPGRVYRERSSGDVELESPVVPDLPNGGPRPWNAR